MTELKKPEPTIVDRVNAAAAKVSDVLMEARNAARDELLWLAAQYRELLTERNALAAKVKRLAEALETCLEMEERPKVIELARAALATAQQPTETVVEAVARAICVACEENPDHEGDARGNDFRWQDYRDAALAAINALATQQPGGSDNDR